MKQPGQRRAQDLADAPLVRRVGVGVEQADRDRLDTASPRARSPAPHARPRRAPSRPRRAVRSARRPRSGVAAAPAAAASRRAARRAAARGCAASPARRGSRGGDQRGPGALAFEDRVGGDGRAVQHLVEILPAVSAELGAISASMPSMIASRIVVAASTGLLQVDSSPSGDRQAMSVNVPPTSAAIRNHAAHLRRHPDSWRAWPRRLRCRDPDRSSGRIAPSLHSEGVGADVVLVVAACRRRKDARRLAR